jgi:Family of unknown function (DUF5681)
VKWRKGESGNPHGRTPGYSNVAKLRQAIAEHIPDILETLLGAAKAGDTAAAKLLLERCLPALKPMDSPVTLGAFTGTLTERAGQLLGAMASGQLTPGETVALLRALGEVARITEVDELAKRVAALEESRGEPQRAR